MSKAKQESVAEILARQKTNTIKKETKKKPATKKAGVIVGKKKKISKPIATKKNKHIKKTKQDLDNMRKPDVYLEFIRFTATLPNFRKLQNQQEFAKEFGVEESTLSNWKKKEGFWDEVREERKASMKDNMVGNIIMAVYRKAIREGTSKEAKLLLELSGEYEEKRTIDNTHVIKELSEERQEEISKRLDNWFSPDEEEEEEEDSEEKE